jgi:hypothetical protein
MFSLLQNKPIIFFKDLLIRYSIIFNGRGKRKGIIFRNKIQSLFLWIRSQKPSREPYEGGSPLKHDIHTTGMERGYTIQNPPCANCRCNFNYWLSHAHSISLSTLAWSIYIYFFYKKDGTRDGKGTDVVFSACFVCDLTAVPQFCSYFSIPQLFTSHLHTAM